MNALKHLDEFKKLLAHYRVSNEGKAVLDGTKVVLCSAATATGRNTVIRELVKTDKYYFIVSDTTRLPRINDSVQEKSGVEYWFRTEEQMLADLKAGKLLEAEIIHNQQVSGMSIREIAKAQTLNKIAITDIDRGGVDIVVRAKPDAICIFFLPPDYDSWQRRIAARGDMDKGEYERRMETARQELKNALAKPYYHFVVNDDLAKTVYVVDKIASGKESERHAEQARQIAAQILDRLNQG